MSSNSRQQLPLPGLREERAGLLKLLRYLEELPHRADIQTAEERVLVSTLGG